MDKTLKEMMWFTIRVIIGLLILNFVTPEVMKPLGDLPFWKSFIFYLTFAFIFHKSDAK